MRAMIGLLLVGCNPILGVHDFHSADAVPSGDDAPPPAMDASTDGLPPNPLCPADPMLFGCYTFEGTLADGSAFHNDLTSSSPQFAVGHDGAGALLDGSSALLAPDSASFDVAAVTVEAWILPTQLPIGNTRMGILDVDGQYGLFLHPTGLTCTGGVVLVASATIELNHWTHVACTDDGATLTAYVDGVVVAAMAATPPATGVDALAVGGNSPSGEVFVGTLDDVRMWSVARSAAEICADAGCH